MIGPRPRPGHCRDSGTAGGGTHDADGVDATGHRLLVVIAPDDLGRIGEADGSRHHRRPMAVEPLLFEPGGIRTVPEPVGLHDAESDDVGEGPDRL